MQRSELYRGLSDADLKIVKASALEEWPCNIPEQEVEGRFRAALVKVAMICNPKEEITAHMIGLLLPFILENYRTITFSELVVAAQLNYAGKLGERVEHYQCIDIPFIGALLNAYQVRKSQAFRDFKRLCANSEPVMIVVKDPEESYNSLKTYITTNGELPIGWDWSACFDFMWQSVLSDEQKKAAGEWFAKVQPEILADLNKKKFTAISQVEQQAFDAMMKPEAIKQECRKRYVQQYFKPVEPAADPLINILLEYEKGKDDQGFITHNGYDLSKVDFIQVRLNEQNLLTPAQ